MLATEVSHFFNREREKMKCYSEQLNDGQKMTHEERDVRFYYITLNGIQFHCFLGAHLEDRFQIGEHFLHR